MGQATSRISSIEIDELEKVKEFSENLEINGELKQNDNGAIITKPFWWCHSGKFQKILEFITVIFHFKGFLVNSRIFVL